jgi:hypothetical protein
MELRRRIRTRRVTEIALLEGDDSAWAKVDPRLAQQIDRIRLVHQYPAADDCIEVLIQVKVLNVTLLEDHRRPSHRLDAKHCRVEDVRIRINAYDPALRADKFSQEQCNVTRTATKIKNLHARGDACRSKEPSGERPVDLILGDQPMGLRIGAT